MTIATRIREQLAAYARIAIWGAGRGGQQAYTAWLPREKVVWFIGRNGGAALFGKPVLEPTAAEALAVDCIVICADAYLEILEELRNLGYGGAVHYVFDLFPRADESGELRKLQVDILSQKAWGWIEFFIQRPQFLVNVTFRLAKAAGGIPVVGTALRVLHTLVSVFFSISLPVTVEAGPGLSFSHFGGIVVHPRARLGSFVRIYHCATIGSNDMGGVPEVGSFCTLYTGALVLGSSRVGDHSRVGAHTIMNDMSCPPGATVVGFPARVARIRDPGPGWRQAMNGPEGEKQ